VTERYAALQKPMSIRKQKLMDSLQVQQLFRDIEDEEAWIREKEPVAASTNRGLNKLHFYILVFIYIFHSKICSSIYVLKKVITYRILRKLP
jgi:hypothetical protein